MVHLTNYFKVFDSNMTGMKDQASFETDATMADGYSTGIVRSDLMNKILHQATIMSAAIAGVVEDAGLNALDTDLDALKENLKTVFSGQKVYYSFESVSSGYSASEPLKNVLAAMAVNSALYAVVTSNTYYPASGFMVLRKFSATSASGEIIATDGKCYELYVSDITANILAANWVLPVPKAHNHAASDINSGTLPIARGGTNMGSNPSMLTNLGSTTAANVFTTSPRPGVTGTLGSGNGGTGQTSFGDLMKALCGGSETLEASDNGVVRMMGAFSNLVGADAKTDIAKTGCAYITTMTAEKDYPASGRGYLLQFGSSGSNYMFQLCAILKNGGIELYTRSKYGTVYSDWSKIEASGVLATDIQALLTGGEISVVKKVQRGVYVGGASLSSVNATATITSVNPEKSVCNLLGIKFSTSSDGSSYVGGYVSLESATKVRLVADSGVAAVKVSAISWEVIEYY